MPDPPQPREWVDLQDILLLVSFICLEAGVAAFDWRIALIVAGIITGAAVFAIERSKTPRQQQAKSGKETASFVPRPGHEL